MMFCKKVLFTFFFFSEKISSTGILFVHWHFTCPLSSVFCLLPISGPYLRLWLYYVLLWVRGVVQYFSFLLFFVPSKMTSELFKLKGTCYFLCVSLWNSVFLSLPAPGEIVLWLRICRADIPPSLPVIKKYLFFCQPKAV